MTMVGQPRNAENGELISPPVLSRSCYFRVIAFRRMQNDMAGHRFGSFEGIEKWLNDWCEDLVFRGGIRKLLQKLLGAESDLVHLSLETTITELLRVVPKVGYVIEYIRNVIWGLIFEFKLTAIICF